MENNTPDIGVKESILLIKERFKALTPKEKFVLAAGTLVFLFLAWRIGLPWYAEYQYRIGYGYQVQNKLEMAMDSYKKAVKAQPLETQYQIELGKVYEDFARTQNDLRVRYDYLQKAEKLYNTMVKLNPENPWYQNRLAEIYNLYSQYFKQISMIPGTDEAARKDAEHKAMGFAKKSEDKIYYSATLDPNNPLFKMSIAYLYHQRMQFDQALKEYQKIIDIDDQFAEAYFNMADIYIQQKKLDMALSTYDKINQFRPNFNNLHLMIGKIYLQQGKAKAAKEEFIKELEGNRNNVAGYQMLGSQLYQERDFVNASKILSRAVEMQPTNAQYIYYLGICYINTNQFALAQTQFEKVLELAPGNPQALQALAFVRGKLQ
jgi:tetratricopeptide (TPR) repeat protein